MTTPLPSRLRESAKAMKSLDSVSLRPSTLALIDRESAARIAAELTEAADALEAGPWMPIETAPRGSGEDGPDNVNDPGYVEPPKLLLWTAEGPVVGYYDWYYHPGYGRGAEPGESTWRNQEGGRTYGVTHWMPLPAAPAAQVAQEGGGVATDGALSPHAAALTVDTVLERLDFMAGHEASAIVRDTAEAAAAMIRAARGVATDGGDDAREP